MKNKIFGGLGLLWGAIILANQFMAGSSKLPSGASAFAAGQYLGLILGAALLLAGLYFLFKKPAAAKGKPEV